MYVCLFSEFLHFQKVGDEKVGITTPNRTGQENENKKFHDHGVTNNNPEKQTLPKYDIRTDEPNSSNTVSNSQHSNQVETEQYKPTPAEPELDLNLNATSETPDIKQSMLDTTMNTLDQSFSNSSLKQISTTSTSRRKRKQKPLDDCKPDGGGNLNSTVERKVYRTRSREKATTNTCQNQQASRSGALSTQEASANEPSSNLPQKPAENTTIQEDLVQDFVTTILNRAAESLW